MRPGPERLMPHRLVEPFQKGETTTFMEHVKAGLEALAEDPSALLVFSGYVTALDLEA
jgi:hypothetical protein